MQVPNLSWSDTVLMACYLVNRMPSSILGGQIHRVLFSDHPLYTLPPRVFDCTCYVHALDLRVTSLICGLSSMFFLGTLELKKGYKCYSLVLRHP